eukprot:7167134-Prymnesium_polylepis.1
MSDRICNRGESHTHSASGDTRQSVGRHTSLEVRGAGRRCIAETGGRKRKRLKERRRRLLWRWRRRRRHTGHNTRHARHVSGFGEKGASPRWTAPQRPRVQLHTLSDWSASPKPSFSTVRFSRHRCSRHEHARMHTTAKSSYTGADPRFSIPSDMAVAVGAARARMPSHLGLNPPLCAAEARITLSDPT